MTVLEPMMEKGACAVMTEPAKRHGPRQVMLSAFTTLGVGGPAELWVCHNFDELSEATLEPYRLQVTLSDLNGFDPLIHHGEPEDLSGDVLVHPMQPDEWPPLPISVRIKTTPTSRQRFSGPSSAANRTR